MSFGAITELHQRFPHPIIIKKIVLALALRLHLFDAWPVAHGIIITKPVLVQQAINSLATSATKHFIVLQVMATGAHITTVVAGA